MAKRGLEFLYNRQTKPKRSTFNLSYENKLTCNMGELIPFYIQDVCPRDTFKVSNDYLMRAQPMLAPLMHRVDVSQHYFFVPLRLIWDEFELFITGGEIGEETAQMPYITASDIRSLLGQQQSDEELFAKKWLDLLGYPTNVPPTFVPSQVMDDTKISTLRLRAANFVWNEYYRDQNLQEEKLFTTASGHDVLTGSGKTLQVELLRRAWRKDYFTSALPFAQRGPSIGLPWTGGDIKLDYDPQNGHFQKLVDEYGNDITGTGYLGVQSGTIGMSDPYHMLNVTGTDPDTGTLSQGQIPKNFNQKVNLDPNGTMRIDQLEININDFRRANAIQRWLEKNARSGGRYVEQILSHFGIHPKDYRLDRPEYLGGGRQPLAISEVVQSSATGPQDFTPQANLAGKGTATNSQFVFDRTFDEHGIIIGFMSLIPSGGYQQGLSRHLTKMDKFDFMQPEFANIGEQEVKEHEIYYMSTNSADPDDPTKNLNDKTFGYQARYAEYKYTPDEVHGDFKDSLEYWHLNRKFANMPNLNGDFITCMPDKRIFAVTRQNVDSFLFDIYNSVQARRCLPTYSTPAI